MSTDELKYLFLLLVSIPLGHFIKTRDSFRQRKYWSSGIGAAMIVVFCGKHGFHSLFTTIVNSLIVCLLPRRISHVVSFVWCFGYIVFFRIPHYFGLPPVHPLANAIQLILTLKLVGVAFEVHDAFETDRALEATKDDEKLAKLHLKKTYQNIYPSFIDLLMYSFCYIGLMTGPYYKYRTYHDMLTEKNAENIETLAPMLRRFVRAPLYGAGFLIVSYYFSLEFTGQDEFYEQPFWFRLFYMVPMFFVFRMRFYVAWILAECMCMSAGLGAYPCASKPRVGSGPSDLAQLDHCKQQASEGIAYNFETIRNIDEWGCDFAPTVRDGLRSWNMTIQYWMASHVYRRVPIKAAPVKVALTMGLSAFWHGIHPGYYFSFLSVVPCLIAEDLLIAKLRKNKPVLQQQTFDWLCWFHKQRQFDYMSMGFLLLSMERTFRYWRSIYYCMHVFVSLMVVLGLVLQVAMPRTKRSERAEEKPPTEGAATKKDQ